MKQSSFVNKRYRSYTVVVLLFLLLSSCEYKEEIRLVKDQKIITPNDINWINIENMGVESISSDITVDDLYNEIALLIDGKIEYNTLDISSFTGDCQKLLSERFSLSKYVSVTIYNHSDTMCGWALYAVNIRLKVVETIAGRIGEDEEGTWAGPIYNARLLFEYSRLRNNKGYRNSYDSIDYGTEQSSKKDSEKLFNDEKDSISIDDPDPVSF